MHTFSEAQGRTGVALRLGLAVHAICLDLVSSIINLSYLDNREKRGYKRWAQRRRSAIWQRIGQERKGWVD